ncbi:MAG: hypothetical protein LBE49_08430 [Deltaproteobacteria bacterium]|jgi:shikimate kinase/3-dehydroquinate synthase|nr:hypothetical protein [Deltaproteobacteria bacterium]
MKGPRHFSENLSVSPQSAQKPWPERHIILTGFMGAGKTTVGRMLSQKLGRPFVDLDEELERRHHKPIREIFLDRGEDFFRKAESALLLSLIDRDRPIVLATGGGVVETPANFPLLSSSLTFFLDLGPEAAWGRIGGSDPSRPNAPSFESFKKLYLKRRPLYQSSGRVMEAGAAPEKVTELICGHVLEESPVTLACEGRDCLIRTYAPLSRWPILAASLLGPRKAMVLLDSHFKESEEKVSDIFGSSKVVYAEANGEAAKTLAEAGRLLSLMAEEKLARDDFLIVIGGGSLSDLGAFCAGLYRRGLNLVIAPTTLLSAVDASVGGKTAVNLSGAKNQVGHFYLPREVWMDPFVLSDLPMALRLEGLTEAYKTGLALDPLLAAAVEGPIDSILNGDVPLTSEIIHRSAAAKAGLVEKDFREVLGIRDILNLGHTYGHAVESYHSPKVSHGRAVALGLAVALKYSETHLGFPPKLADKGVELCLKLAGGEFPSAPPENEASSLLLFDKKIRGGKLKYVGLSALGSPVVLEADPGAILAIAKALAPGEA